MSCVSVVWASPSGQCSVVGAPGLGRSSRWRVRGLFQFMLVVNKAPVGVCVRISAGMCASVSQWDGCAIQVGERFSCPDTAVFQCGRPTSLSRPRRAGAPASPQPHQCPHCPWCPF